MLEGQTQLATRTEVRFNSSPNARVRYDNIAFSTPDPGETAYVYNAANEMTMTVEDGVATQYTYDDWGRTLSKFQGDGSTVHAEYHYRYGDKLKWYTTTFAGESRVDYNYDGLGKRRNKMVNQSGLIWYRWEGWNELGAYAEGTDPNTTWDIGALERYYVPRPRGLPGQQSGHGRNLELSPDRSPRQPPDGARPEQANPRSLRLYALR